MSEYDREEKSKVILKGLKKLDLEVSAGKSHDTASILSTGHKTTVPRHKKLNKYIVGSIVEFLLNNGYKEEEIKKAFKWK